MSVATLLKFPTTKHGYPTFAFEHAMAHRTLLAGFAQIVQNIYQPPTPPPTPEDPNPVPPPPVITYPQNQIPLSDFSVLPYLLDPMQEIIPDFGWSPSSKQLAVVRLKTSSDVVLIKDQQERGKD